MMRCLSGGLAAAVFALAGLSAQPARTVLFVGNSFTFADRSPVHFYRAGTVSDLNHEGNGGVPALFQTFAAEAGLDYHVSLETHPGVGLDWHLAHRSELLGERPWDVVIMHGYSTLDADRPGDPSTLIASVRGMAELLRRRNPAVEIHLMATWPRADQTYVPTGHWAGRPIEAMADDVEAGYEQAAAAAAPIASVTPVGEAWIRAIQEGVADPNPYDGIDAGKLDLWSYDHYHASTYGYYLEALTVFGDVTGRDPRSLTENECSAFELGLSPAQAKALQQVAFDELTRAGRHLTGPSAPASRPRGRCPGVTP
jgi:hypothetical protein